MAHLKENRRFEYSLLVTFPGFGRRVAQNASGSTDYGTAKYDVYDRWGATTERSDQSDPLGFSRHVTLE